MYYSLSSHHVNLPNRLSTRS